MLTKEENEPLTRVGRHADGQLMRRFWRPVALAEELPEGAAPVPTRLLGEDLVLFRDDAGRGRPPGAVLLASRRHLSYGSRGWRPALPLPRLAVRRRRNCLEQPAEPRGSTFHTQDSPPRISVYRGRRRHLGVHGTWEAAALPMYEPLAVPAEYRDWRKVYEDCTTCSPWRAASIPRTPRSCTASS